MIQSKPKVALFGIAVLAMVAFVAYPAFTGQNALDFFATSYWVILLTIFPIIVAVGIAKTRLSVTTDKIYETYMNDLFPFGKEKFQIQTSDLSNAFSQAFLFALRKRADAEKNLATGISLTGLAVVLSVILVIVSQAPQNSLLPRDDFIWKYIFPKAAVILFIEIIASFFLNRYSKNISVADAIEADTVRKVENIALLNLIRSNNEENDPAITDFVKITLAQRRDLWPQTGAEENNTTAAGLSKLVDSVSSNFGK